MDRKENQELLTLAKTIGILYAGCCFLSAASLVTVATVIISAIVKRKR